MSRINMLRAGCAAALVFVHLTACSPAPASTSEGRLRVVATTSILGDVVGEIGGERIDLTVLVPVGSEPHSFEPSPRDAAAVAEAEVVFSVGLGLEGFLEPLLENAGRDAILTPVSNGVDTLDAAGEEHGGADPHVWMDPDSVSIWADNIAAALAAADPAHAVEYADNAAAYQAKLDELDTWAMDQVELVPQEARVLVTDHEALGYFAAHYGFEIVGTVVPGVSTLSEPSAAQLAELENQISNLGVGAIFIGVTANPDLAERVAADTGVELVRLYAESISGAEGPAPTYLELMRYDVNAIVGALGE